MFGSCYFRILYFNSKLYFFLFRLQMLREERENYQEKIDKKDNGRSATKTIIMVSISLSWK